MSRTGPSMTRSGTFLLLMLGVVAGTIAAADSAGRYRRPRVAADSTATMVVQNGNTREDPVLGSGTPSEKEKPGSNARSDGASRAELQRRSLKADAEFGAMNGVESTDPHDLNPTPGDDELLSPNEKTGEEQGAEENPADGSSLKSSIEKKTTLTDDTATAKGDQSQDPQSMAWDKAEKERRQKREKEFREQQQRAWEEAHRPTAWQLQNPSGLQNRDPSLQQRGYVAPNTYFGPQFRAWNNQSPPIVVRELPPNRTMVPPLTRTNVMLAPNTYYGSGNARWNQISPGRAAINPLGGWNMSPGW